MATFTFDTPAFLAAETEALGETTGMYLRDKEGTIKTTEVALGPAARQRSSGEMHFRLFGLLRNSHAVGSSG